MDNYNLTNMDYWTLSYEKDKVGRERIGHTLNERERNDFWSKDNVKKSLLRMYIHQLVTAIKNEINSICSGSKEEFNSLFTNENNEDTFSDRLKTYLDFWFTNLNQAFYDHGIDREISYELYSPYEDGKVKSIMDFDIYSFDLIIHVKSTEHDDVDYCGNFIIRKLD